jgi:glycosyltransferase involved in cell wall biosynthesis
MLKVTNDDIWLSIIIPVYNCEKYINNCLDILIKISTKFSKEIEIIVIDDGSKDNTYQILKTYEYYGFIKINRKENGGVSSARNAGLRMAQGRYITFIDGDDWVSDNYFVIIFDHIPENEDVIIFNFYRHISARKFPIKLSKNDTSSLEYKFMNYPVLMNSVWNKVFRYEIIKKYNVSFDESISASEDLMFVFKILSKAERVLFIDDILYNYRLNYYSATQNLNQKHLLDSVRVAEKIECFIQEENATGFSSFLIYQKLFAKRPYLTEIKYYNYKRWSETFPETNNWALSFGRGLFDKLLYTFIMLKMPLITHCICLLYCFIKSKIKYLLYKSQLP